MYHDEYAETGAVVPILKQGRCAGCFLVLSTQSNFFSAHVLTMFQRYCELMAIAPHDNEWYAPEQFAFHVMPPVSTQQAYLACFFDRVSLLCKNQADGSLANALQAERVVYQQIEAELISASSSGMYA